PGAVDIAPGTLDHWFEFATGGAGRFLLNTMDGPLKLLQGEPVDAYRIPFVRKVYGEVTDRAVRDDYYAALTDIGYVRKEYEAARSARDARRATDIRRQHLEEMRLIGRAEASEKRVKKLREQRKTVDASSLGKRLKRQRLDEI